MTTIKYLTPGQKIRLGAWHQSICVTFDTARNYRLRDETPDQSFNRAFERGHHTAWTVHAGTSISSNRAFYDRQWAEAAAAVTVEDGEIIGVIGEPETYKVKVMKGNADTPRNSDPIHMLLQPRTFAEPTAEELEAAGPFIA